MPLPLVLAGTEGGGGGVTARYSSVVSDSVVAANAWKTGLRGSTGGMPCCDLEFGSDLGGALPTRPELPGPDPGPDPEWSCD